MKLLLLSLMAINVLVIQSVTTAVAQETKNSAECTKIDLKKDAKSIWYVPANHEKVHFVSPAGDNLNKYVIKGDLLISTTETQDSICAHYIKKGKVTASGWLKKSEIESFQLVDFGAFDVNESQKLISKANKALISLAKHLPDIKDWHGTYRDKSTNSVRIWKKGPLWRLNTMGIVGTIGTGNNEEDSQDITTYGAKAEYRVDKDKYDVCDIVIIGFNNALLATSGSHCMGSGANHEFPEFSGLYWKQ